MNTIIRSLPLFLLLCSVAIRPMADTSPQEGHDTSLASSNPTTPPALDECLICSEPIEQTVPIMSLLCHHTFHTHCINRWLNINPSCPTCRAPVAGRPNIAGRPSIEGINTELRNIIELLQQQEQPQLTVEERLGRDRLKKRNLIIIGTVAVVSYGWPFVVLGCKKLIALSKNKNEHQGATQ